MFESLRIRNLKSLRDTTDELRFSQLNILVGPNNSGKSSILAALLLLKQSLEDKDPTTGLVTSGPLIDLGSYLDVIPGDPTETPLQLSFTLSPQLETELPFPTPDEGHGKTFLYDSFDFSFAYDRRKNDVRVNRFAMEHRKSGQALSGEHRHSGWKLTGVPEHLVPHLDVSLAHFVPTLRLAGPQPSDQKILERAMFSHLVSVMQLQHLTHLFSQVSYVGPIRQQIPYYAVMGTMPHSELGPSGQNLMRVLAATEPIPGGRKRLIEGLNQWLDRRLGLLRNIRLRKLDRGGTVRALVGEAQGGLRVNLAGTGSGISQIAPVVVRTLLTRPNGCLIVEQPEIHLHPAAQTTLADLFIENLSRGRQFIIETHSEHFLLRVRRRVAEGRVKPDAVRVFAVEKPDAWTSIRTMELAPNGHFRDWPKGFFEEGYEEALALAKAGAKVHT